MTMSMQRTRLHAFAVALLAGCAVGPACAQRNNWPGADVIAGADRYDPPKATALAAKLATQPDMTGLWTQLVPSGAGAGPTFDPAHTYYPPQQPLPGEARFGPIPGTYLTNVPYNPEYKRKYEQYIEDAKVGKARDTFAACVPYGVPRMVGDSPVPFDIVQAPEVMVWYNDYGRTERRIFLDGREHPRGTDAGQAFAAGPSYSGHSVGHWEGNTLVVDTVDMIVANFDETSAPHSGQLHMIERLRLIDANIMENQITFTDPEAFEGPWVVTRYYGRGNGDAEGGAKNAGEPAARKQTIVHRYLDLNDRPCIPNVRMDDEGFQVLMLPQEIEAEAAKVGRPPR